jgi:hypothetical protein
MLLNQWRFDWYPMSLARRLAREGFGELHFPEDFVRELIESGELGSGPLLGAGGAGAIAPWARGHGTSWLHVSADDGRSFTRSVVLDTGPFHGGYGLRGAVMLPSGELLLPLNDVPEYRTIFVLRSGDAGLSWREPTLVARQDGHLFTEPALLTLGFGRLLCMFRDDATHIMHQCFSDDGGRTWSSPEPNGIAGYPPHLLQLSDVRLLCTYGVRRPEHSFCAVLSEDEGLSWRLDDVLRLRGNLASSDLGYPATVVLPDGAGRLMSVYYCQDDAGVTGIEAVTWSL